MWKKLCASGIVAAVLVTAVVSLLLFIPMLGLMMPDFISNLLVTDHSAERRGQDNIYWNGHLYVPCSGEYGEGNTIAKTTDGNWDLNEVDEDPSHTFLVMRSFLDDYLLVQEDYAIPTGGTVTTVSWPYQYTTNEVLCQTITDILATAEGQFTYETDGVFQRTDAQHLFRLYVAYEGCPVTTQFQGYLGTLSGQWIITTHISTDIYDAGGAPQPYPVEYYVIPQEHINILASYLE